MDNNDNKNEILKLLGQIASGYIDKDVLSKKNTIELFKEYLTDAKGIAYEIEKLSTPSVKDQNLLHSTGNIVLQTFSIDKDILNKILAQANFTKEQRTDLLSACKNTMDTLDGEVGLLFKSHSENRLLIENQEIRPLIKSPNKSKILAETAERAFITYLIHEGLPSVVLERLARLSLYQQLHFADDLRANKEFGMLYKTYNKTGVLEKRDIIFATKTIEQSLLKNLKNYPFNIGVHSVNGYQHLTRNPVDKTDRELLHGRAKGNYFDAYSVKNNKIHVTNVTLQADLESNKMASIDSARIISNTLKEGTTDFKDYAVTSYCNSPVYNSNEIDTIQMKLMGEKKLQGAQANSLIELPVTQEIFKILANTHPKEYEELYPHIKIGVYGDNAPAFDLMMSKLQFDVSFDKLSKSADALRLIIDRNPSLNQMVVDTEKLVMSLNNANKYAKEAAFLYNLPKNQTDHVFKKIDDLLISVSEKLISVNSDVATKLNVSEVSPALLNVRKTQLQKVYDDLQVAIKEDKPTLNQQLVNKKDYHGVSLNKDMVDQILNGRYSSANSALLKDAISFRMDYMEEMLITGTFRKNSMVQLRSGFEQAFAKSLDLKDIYQKLVFERPLLLEKIMEGGTGIAADMKLGVEKYKRTKAYKQALENIENSSNSPSI